MGGGFPQAEGLHGGLETIAGGCMMGSISAGEEGGLEIGGTEQNKSVSREISRTTSGDGSYGLNIVRWCHHPRNYWFRSPSRYHGRRVRRQDHHVWPMPARPRGPARASHAQQIQVRSPPHHLHHLGKLGSGRGSVLSNEGHAAAAAIRGGLHNATCGQRELRDHCKH